MEANANHDTTSIWRGNWGSGDGHNSTYAYTISNHAYGSLSSNTIAVSAGQQYTVTAYVRGELDNEASAGSWIIRANFYDSGGAALPCCANAAYGDGSQISTTWAQKGGRVTVPTNAVTMRVSLRLELNSGWVAFDKVSVKQYGVSNPPEKILNTSFETDGANWTANADSQFPATSIWRSNGGTADGYDGQYAYVISNHAYGWLKSDPIAVEGGMAYNLYAWMRGEIDPEDSEYGAALIRAYFYDASGNYITYDDAYGNAPGTITNAWGQRGGEVIAPVNAKTMRIYLFNYLNSGWVAFDDVTIHQATRYYYSGGQRVAMRVGNGTGDLDGLTFLFGDHLGSTSITYTPKLANGSSRTVVQKYKPWGEVRSVSGGKLPTNYTFTGQYSYVDALPASNGKGLGLINYRARWGACTERRCSERRRSDPALGRFAQADSIVPGGVQGLDRFAYVNNNPVRYTDPTGHCIWSSGGVCYIGDNGKATHLPRQYSGSAPVNKSISQRNIIKITGIPKPDGLSPDGEAGYSDLIALIGEEDAWWWDDGVLTLDELLAIYLFAEGASLWQRDENGIAHLPSALIDAYAYKWQKNCGGGWNSAQCFNGFWGYLQRDLKSSPIYMKIFKNNDLNSTQVYGGDVYNRGADDILNHPYITPSDNVPQGWAHIKPTQTKAYQHAQNGSVPGTFAYKNDKIADYIFVILTVNQQNAFCAAMGLHPMCNLTGAP